MTFQELMKTAADNAGYLVAIGGGVAALIKWWKPVSGFVRNRVMFQSDMRVFIKDTNNERRDFFVRYREDCAKWEASAKQGRETQQEVKEITRMLKNGIPHRLALLTAKHIQSVEAMSEPLFICDEEGRNEAVSQGYLDLIGVESVNLLDSTRWKDTVTGPLVETYLKTFSDAVAHRRRYVASVQFQNPFTREDRGVWRVTADCTSVNDALVFTGTFFPEDDRANALAEEYGWRTNPDPQPIHP
jgi:PAS domain-containing protein